MITVDIPGQRIYRFEHLVLDLNGTLAVDGVPIEGVLERLDSLRKLVNILIITADTHGRAREIAALFRVKMHKIAPGNEQVQKLDLVRQLGVENTVSIGNGSNDALMLRASALRICVIGAEGASSEAMSNCDVIVPDINAALDLLIKPNRLVATLRK